MASSEEKKAGLYEKWLKHFTLNVMTQSFHAFLLMFVMNLLAQISNIQENVSAAGSLASNEGVLAIMSIVGMMAIIKFEKLFKDLFGIKDSMAGSAKDSGAQLFAGIKSATTMAGEIKKPFTNYANSKRKMTGLGESVGLKENQIGSYIRHGNSSGAGAGAGAGGGAPVNKPSDSPLSSKTQDLYNNMVAAKKNGDMDSYRDYRNQAVAQMKQEKSFADAKASGALGGGAASRINAGGGASGGAVGGAVAGAAGSLSKQEQEYNDAVLEHRKDKRKVVTQSAINMAALTMGMGATDTMAQAVTVANQINNPMNAAANRYIDHGETKTAASSTGDSVRYNDRSISDAISKGFANIKDRSKDSNGNVSSVKFTVEAAKSYAGLPVNVVKNAVTSSKVGSVDNL